MTNYYISRCRQQIIHSVTFCRNVPSYVPGAKFDGVESYRRFEPDLMSFRVTKGDKIIVLMVNQECFDFYKDEHLYLKFTDPTLKEITKMWLYY